MRVKRIPFLNTLKSVSPGLSKREIVEQSSCFVFSNNRVTTYNDEIACSSECEIGLEGAVQAEPLIAILDKLVEDDLEIKEGEGELLYRGTKREGGIRMESEILLPVDDVEQPTKKDKWVELADEFADAVNIVGKCAGKDASNFNLTCIHIYPKWVEAYDNLQVARYKVRTGVQEATLVRRDSIKHIQQLGMTHIAATKSWLHFKNSEGLVMSCRRYLRDELDTTAMLDVDTLLDVHGTEATLPKGLEEAAQKAEVFSQDNSDDNLVTVELRKGKIRITGRGVSGWYRETKTTDYAGSPLAFKIDPTLLAEITERHKSCEITEERLKVTSAKFVYVTCLGDMEEKA